MSIGTSLCREEGGVWKEEEVCVCVCVWEEEVCGVRKRGVREGCVRGGEKWGGGGGEGRGGGGGRRKGVCGEEKRDIFGGEEKGICVGEGTVWVQVREEACLCVVSAKFVSTDSEQ